MPITIHNSKNQSWLFLFLSCITIFILIWDALFVWYFQLDALGRIPFAILIFSSLIIFPFAKKLLFRSPIPIYFILAIYMIINGVLLQGYMNYDMGQKGIFVLFTDLLEPAIFMFICAYMAYTNFDKTLTVVNIGLYFYCILCLLNGSMDIENRFTGGLNANEMAIRACFCYFGILLAILRNKKSILLLIVLAIVPLYLILLSGSRTALVTILVVTFFSLFEIIDKRKKSSIFFLVIGMSLFLLIAWYVVTHTFIGERLLSSSSRLDDTIYLTGTFWDKFGDRGIQYYYSWPIFLEHPLFGMGFHNWISLSDLGMVFHSEWCVQYAECGLVGITLYLIFLISQAKSIRPYRQSENNKTRVTAKTLLLVLICILLINTVSWTYNFHCVFAYFGLMVGFTKEKDD